MIFKALLGNFSQQFQPIQLPESTEPPREPYTKTIEPPWKPVQQPKEHPQRTSPLHDSTASEASHSTDQPVCESQLMLNKPEKSISQPLAFSSGVTEASVEEDNLDSHVFHDFEGLDWRRSKRFVAPLSTPRGKASWVFKHGWRVWKEDCEMEGIACCIG